MPKTQEEQRSQAQKTEQQWNMYNKVTPFKEGWLM